eukprot:gene24251-biopygen18728
MMFRTYAVLAAVVVQSLIGEAGGINTWCAFSDPFIPGSELNRTTYFGGANACKILTFADNPTNCPTSDGWGIDVAQCVYPGYNPIAQPVSFPSTTVLPGYPGTYNQILACNQVVFTSVLVDSANVTYGELRVFKDYSDMLTPPPPPFTAAAGMVIVSDAANYDPTLSNAAYINQLNISSTTPSQFWSCWTYEVDLKAACNPMTSKHFISGSNSSGTGCVPNNVLDLTATPNLFLYVEFTIVALDLFNTSDSTLGPSCGTVDGTKTIKLPGSGVVDLYAATIGLPNTQITSTFYLNESALTSQSCIAMDIIIADVLIGRQYIRVGCDVVAGPLAQLYYKVQFNSEADRDFLFYASANPFFWGSVVYPNVKPGCGFFGLYTQTIGFNGAFSEPVFGKAPSAQPFVAVPTVDNPYYTACTSFTPANATTGMDTPINNMTNSSAVFGWVPAQLPSPFGQYSFGGSCIANGCTVPIGTNLGINNALYTSAMVPAICIIVTMTKNFSAALPFDIQTDPGRLSQNLNLLCGTGVRTAFGGQLFVPTGTQAAGQIQVGALAFSAVDQTTFSNCINSSPSTIQVIALAYSMECTDFITIAYSCIAQPTSFYSGIANQPAGALHRSSDVLCSDSTATGSVLTVVFTQQSCATELYIKMTAGAGVLTAGYVQSASIPCAAVLLLQTSGQADFYIEVPITTTNGVSGTTITSSSCPPFSSAIAAVLARYPTGPLDPSVIYPTNGTANGCSIVSISPPGAPVRVFYKAYLTMTSGQWAWFFSTAGSANAAFVLDANVVCSSVMSYGPAIDFAAITYTSAEIPALANPGQCTATVGPVVSPSPPAVLTDYQFYIETPIVRGSVPLGNDVGVN